MTAEERSNEIWVLGATGRTGSGVASELGRRGHEVVLVGRDRARLDAVVGSVDGTARAEVVDGAGIAAAVAAARPAVVVNTIGAFAQTATQIARSCLYGGHYLDLANDVVAVPRLLALDRDARAARSTLVTGAGFGVLATEAVVVELCRDRPTPRSVQVDAIASVVTGAGEMGAAFAETVVDVITTGGRRYSGGRLVRARIGADVARLTLPDGESSVSASVPSGELMAAHSASGAPEVTFTSALASASAVVRAALPVATMLLSVPALRRSAVRRMAATTVQDAPRPRRHSWGHAVVTWADGTTREGWLRADDAMDYTVAVLAEAATRLAAGTAPHGAYTPAAAFGSELAVAAGGTFVEGPSTSFPRIRGRG